MKWITPERPHVDRVACPWLIERFIDLDAEFIYVAADRLAQEAERQVATSFDITGAELGHHGAECSFDAFVHGYGLGSDPAMAYMATVIRGADTDDKMLGSTRTAACVRRPGEHPVSTPDAAMPNPRMGGPSL